MEATAKRMLELRTGLNISQMKLSKAIGISQAAINRYEHNSSAVPDSVLLKYADFFDVSADYILGRADKPEGKLFSVCPKIAEDNEELRQFIEMCFDPNSKISGRLKDTLYNMMTGGDKS